MLVLLTLCGALLALTQWLAPLTVVAIAFFLLCVAAHVAGNAMGSRLREHPADRPTLFDEGRPAPGRLSADHFAPPTRLRESASLGWPLFAATMIGLVGGGAVGGYWVILSSPKTPAELNVVVGVVACAVLGAIFSFVGVGFLQVGGGAIWQSLQMSQRRRDG